MPQGDEVAMSDIFLGKEGYMKKMHEAKMKNTCPVKLIKTIIGGSEKVKSPLLAFLLNKGEEETPTKSDRM